MKSFSTSRPSPAIIVAVIALVFALVGSAVAGTDGLSSKITKSKVKSISKKQADKELKANIAGSHVNTADKATKASDSDALGGAGAASYLKFSSGTIPSGSTSVGVWRVIDDADAVSDDRFYTVQLPGKTPVPLAFTSVNFAAGTPGATDGDAACTGTVQNPTAPAGKACLYRSDASNISALAGFQSSSVLADNLFGFSVRATSTAAGQMNASGSWAYTAP
ncbi:MAG: hypothetical protein ACHQJ5_03340 [Vicinamibacteria bacterium]|jgi:hypothetical protein